MPDAGATQINATTFPGLVGQIQNESQVIGSQMGAFPSDVNVRFVPTLLGNTNPGALAESRPEGRTWVVGIDASAMAGSKVALAMRIAHELEHGLKFFNEFNGDRAAWIAAAGASRAMLNYSNLATKMYSAGRGSSIEQGLLRTAITAQDRYFNRNPFETPSYQRSAAVYSEYFGQ